MSTTEKAPAAPQIETPIPKAPATRTPSLPRWPVAWRALPNVLVFGLLGGILYAGHHTGWKLDRLSELTGAASVPKDDWCAAHLVPESACVECQIELYPKGKPWGFCREHGVAECVIHHPELAQVKDSPQLPQYDSVAAIRLIARKENNSRNTLHSHRIQFASAEGVAKAGIDVDLVQERLMVDEIVANGDVRFDPARVAHLAPRVPGTVAVVFKTLGDEVVPDETLALVDAAQVGQAKAQLIQAIVQVQLRKTTMDRLRPIAISGAVAQKSINEAEVALRESEITVVTARQALANLGLEVPEQFVSADPNEIIDQLRFLGIPPALVATLPQSARTANLIPLRAPYAGVIVASHVVAGEVVDSAGTLFTVADPSRLWLQLNVREEDARHVRRGLPVEFVTDDDRSATVRGTVAWISPAVDEHTRTLQVRVPVENADGRLREKAFGTGRILLRKEPQAVVVPRESVQSTADASFVFVRDKNFFDPDAPKIFHVRQVRIGAQDDQFVELLAGALPGEVVATKGSAALLAQLLRGNLGAGCGCHDH